MSTSLSDNLRVDINAFVNEAKVNNIVDAGFVPDSQYPMGEDIICDWSFFGARLKKLPFFRSLLQEFDIKGSEQWTSNAARAFQDTSLVLLDCPPLKGTSISPDLIETILCSNCGSYHWSWVPPATRPVLHIPVDRCPQMFELEAGTMTIASHTLLKTLQELDLTRGIDWIEAEVYPPRDESSFILKPMTSIGWPVAPFGYREGPCEECGHFLGQFSIYPIYNKPSPDSDIDWMSVANLAPTRLVIRPRVFSELSKHVPRLERTRLGWFPEEVDQAFAPVQYRT
jgi:hypothetical protein